MVTKSFSKVYVVLCDYLFDGKLLSQGRYVSMFSTSEAAFCFANKLNLAFSSSDSYEVRYYVIVEIIQ